MAATDLPCPSQDQKHSISLSQFGLSRSRNETCHLSQEYPATSKVSCHYPRGRGWRRLFRFFSWAPKDQPEHNGWNSFQRERRIMLSLFLSQGDVTLFLTETACSHCTSSIDSVHATLCECLILSLKVRLWPANSPPAFLFRLVRARLKYPCRESYAPNSIGRLSL